jgi:peptidoglycan hydrolase-like protein with peptidoglycan-binding domain
MPVSLAVVRPVTVPSSAMLVVVLACATCAAVYMAGVRASFASVAPTAAKESWLWDGDGKEVQQRLLVLKYYNGPTDGAFSDATPKAIQKWQEKHQVTATGRLGPVQMRPCARKAKACFSVISRPGRARARASTTTTTRPPYCAIVRCS